MKTFLVLAAVAGSLAAPFAGPAHAAMNSRAQCYDAVIAACNKKPDHAVNACVKNGLDQCDGQFKANTGSSQNGTVRPTAAGNFRIR